MSSFQQLLKDNRHGASYLYHEFLHFLLKKSKTRKEAMSLSKKMHKAHPSMAEFISWYHRFSRNKDKKWRDVVIQEIRKLKSDQERVCKKAVQRLKSCRSIFTYSSSSLVFQTIIQLPKKTKIYLTESRPMMEGKDLARALSRKGYRVTFGVDAIAGEFIKKADAVLLGCDALTPTKYIHKIGTEAIVLLAKKYRIPVFVLAPPQKVLGTKEARNLWLSESLPQEVWNKPPRYIDVRNYYFEEVPRKKIRLIL